MCKPTPPDSLQKAANRSIFACVLLVLLLLGALAHYLPSLDHSRYFHADISNVALPLLSAMPYTRAERCFFTVALSRCSSPHLPVLCTSLLLSVTGNLFLPDPPPAPAPPPFQRPEEQIKQASPGRDKKATGQSIRGHVFLFLLIYIVF